LDTLKEMVCEAARRLGSPVHDALPWGSVSGMDRATGHVAITPGHHPPHTLRPEQIDFLLAREEPPPHAPRDLPTHLVLYKAFPEIGGIVQLSSHFATCWAQAQKPLPCLGALHAGHFFGEIPVTAPLTEVEVEGQYEYHLGKAIVRRFAELDPGLLPAVLIAGHGPLCWGESPAQAVEHALVLEEVARLAWNTLALNPVAQPMERHTLERHFHRGQSAPAAHGQ